MYSSLLIGLAATVGVPAATDAPKTESSIVGEWVLEKNTVSGDDRAIAADGELITFTTDDTMTVRKGTNQGEPASYKVDPKKDPAEIDVTPPAKYKLPTMHGIFKIEGDTLTICIAPDNKRPTKFESPKGSELKLLVLKRAKKR